METKFKITAGILVIFSLIIGGVNASNTNVYWEPNEAGCTPGTRTASCSAGQCVDCQSVCKNGDNVYYYGDGVWLCYQGKWDKCNSPSEGDSRGNWVCRSGLWKISQLTCPDGTPYGQCSTTNPKYCLNGNLVDNCSICVCSTGESCNSSSGKCELPKPDLRVKSLTLNPQNSIQNPDVTVIAVIKNQGTATATDVRVNFYVGWIEKDYKIIPSIDGNSEKIIYFYWIAESGNHELKVVADPYDNISELDEGNNEYTLEVGTIDYELLNAAGELRETFEDTTGDVVYKASDIAGGTAWKAVEFGTEYVIGKIGDFLKGFAKSGQEKILLDSFLTRNSAMLVGVSSIVRGSDARAWARGKFQNFFMEGPVIDGQYYIDESIENLEYFKSYLYENGLNEDPERVVGYIKKKEKIILNKPNMPVISVIGESLGTDLSWIGSTSTITGWSCVILPGPQCGLIWAITSSFNTIYKTFKLTYDLNDILGWIILIGAAIVIIIIIVGGVLSGVGVVSLSAVLSAAGSLLALIKALFSAKGMTVAFLFLLTLDGVFTGHVMVPVMHENYATTLDDIMSGNIPEFINDPEGPYISQFQMSDIPLFENRTFTINFVNTLNHSLNTSALILLKSQSGDILGELPSQPKIVDINETVTYDINLYGIIPGTYIASAMVIYDKVYVTPPVSKSFRITSPEINIINITTDKNNYQIGEEVNIITQFENSMSSNVNGLTLWTILVAPDFGGTIIANKEESVSGEPGTHNMQTTISTVNSSTEGIYTLNVMLFYGIWVIEEYKTSVIIGNGTYNGAIINEIKTKEAYSGDEEISYNVTITNSGNVDLGNINITSRLIDTSLNNISSNHQHISNLTVNASIILPITLPQQTLSSGKYALEIKIVNESVYAFDTEVTEIIIRGNGTLIPITQLDKKLYHLGETIQISTIVRDELGYYIEDANITAIIYDSLQNNISTVILSKKENSTYKGNFTLSEITTGGTYKVSIHALKKGYSCIDDEIHFDVFYQTKLNVALSTDKDIYLRNESMTLNLRIMINGELVDSYFIARVIYPGGTNHTVPFYKTDMDSQGRYMGIFTKTNLFGNYTFTVETISIKYENVNDSKTISVIDSELKPDLAVDDILYDPIYPVIGENIGIEIKIRNMRNITINNTNVALLIDDTLIDNETFNISENAQITKTFNWTVSQKIHNITAIVDYNNETDELDENNNKLTKIVYEPMPDLTPVDIVFNLSDLVENQSTYAVTVIENQGTKDANNTKISLIIDNTTINSTTLNISANSLINVTFNWTAVRGIHNLTITADPDNVINESNELNNNLTIQVFVADAFVSDDAILTAPSEVKLGEEFNISLFIKNTGTLDLKNVSLSLILSSEFNTTNSIEIDIGNLSVSEERTINWTLKGVKVGYGEILINITSDGNQINQINKSIYCFTCDLNNDGIIIQDYNDLMTTYKCFLGIENDCNHYYQNWNLMNQEYQCFIKNDI